MKALTGERVLWDFCLTLAMDLRSRVSFAMEVDGGNPLLHATQVRSDHSSLTNFPCFDYLVTLEGT